MLSDPFTEAKRAEDRRERFSDPCTQQLPPAAEKLSFATPQAAAEDVKHVALAFGTGVVGNTQRDER
jgi:hypothetical protein